MSNTESNVTDRRSYEHEIDRLNEGGSGDGSVLGCQLGASRLGKWLGVKASGHIQGQSQAARRALLDKWSAPRVPGMGGPVPDSLQYGRQYEMDAFNAYCKLDNLSPLDVHYQPGLRKWDGPEDAVGQHVTPFCVAAPDAMIGDTGLLEIKCPYSLFDDPDVPVYLKPEWLLQVQLQMAAYNKDWCDIVVWHKEYLWIWHVKRDMLHMHLPYQPDQRKRAFDESVITVPTLEPTTFLQAAWPEMLAFVAIDGEQGTKRNSLPRINAEYLQMRNKCVFLRSVKPGAHTNLAAYTKYIGFNNPAVIHDAVHRFSNPLFDLSMSAEQQILLNVRWVPNEHPSNPLNSPCEMKVFAWSRCPRHKEGCPPYCNEAQAPPRGGWISSTYYTYVSYIKHAKQMHRCSYCACNLIPSIDID